MRKSALLWVIVFVLCIPLSLPPASAERSAAVLEVGTSPLCAYHAIADAIAAAQPGDTVKVQNAIFYEPTLIVDQDLTLAGGYNSAHPYGCLTLTGLGRATYQRSGTTAAPAIMVQNAALTMTWFIVELNGYGPGVRVVDGEATLEHVIVRDNDATWGGGVRAVQSRVTLRDSEVRDNTADYGGGLHAADNSSVVAEATLFRGNQGWDLGAGVSLHTGSTFTGLDGTSIESNVTPFGCYEGGGIYAAGAGTEVLLDASQVVSNTALARGGGIYLVDGASATLQNLAVVRENRAFGPAMGAGGGVYLTGSTSSLTVRRAIVSNNWADPVGGGIANDGGTVRLETGLVMSNSTRDAGGGIYSSGGNLYVRDSFLIDNEVGMGNGGGVHAVGTFGAFDIYRTWFIQNRAPEGDGGGVYASHPVMTIARSYFSANSALTDGSAIYFPGTCCAAEEAWLVNNMLVDNVQATPREAGPPAGGSTVYADGLYARLDHNTLAHATPVASFGVHVGSSYTGVEMQNNILANFYIGIRFLPSGLNGATADHTLFYGNEYDYDLGVLSFHEVHANPAFAGGVDYHITAGSAAIDAAASSPVTMDYDGASRPWGPAPDIGADEYPPRRSFYLPVVHKGE